MLGLGLGDVVLVGPFVDVVLVHLSLALFNKYCELLGVGLHVLDGNSKLEIHIRSRFLFFVCCRRIYIRRGNSIS